MLSLRTQQGEQNSNGLQPECNGLQPGLEPLALRSAPCYEETFSTPNPAPRWHEPKKCRHFATKGASGVFFKVSGVFSHVCGSRERAEPTVKTRKPLTGEFNRPCGRLTLRMLFHDYLSRRPGFQVLVSRLGWRPSLVGWRRLCMLFRHVRSRGHPSHPSKKQCNAAQRQ